MDAYAVAVAGQNIKAAPQHNFDNSEINGPAGGLGGGSLAPSRDLVAVQNLENVYTEGITETALMFACGESIYVGSGSFSDKLKTLDLSQ